MSKWEGRNTLGYHTEVMIHSSGMTASILANPPSVQRDLQLLCPVLDRILEICEDD